MQRSYQLKITFNISTLLNTSQLRLRINCEALVLKIQARSRYYIKQLILFSTTGVTILVYINNVNEAYQTDQLCQPFSVCLGGPEAGSRSHCNNHSLQMTIHRRLGNGALYSKKIWLNGYHYI